jgi:hypothetical protein
VLYSFIMYGPYKDDTSVIDTNTVSITHLIVLTFVRFQISASFVVEVSVFMDVTWCKLVVGKQCYGTVC